MISVRLRTSEVTNSPVRFAVRGCRTFWPLCFATHKSFSSRQTSSLEIEISAPNEIIVVCRFRWWLYLAKSSRDRDPENSVPGVPEDVTDIKSSTLANLRSSSSAGQDCRGLRVPRGYWNSTAKVAVRTAKVAIPISGSQISKALLRVIRAAKGRSSVVC